MVAVALCYTRQSLECWWTDRQTDGRTDMVDKDTRILVLYLFYLLKGDVEEKCVTCYRKCIEHVMPNSVLLQWYSQLGTSSQRRKHTSYLQCITNGNKQDNHTKQKSWDSPKRYLEKMVGCSAGCNRKYSKFAWYKLSNGLGHFVKTLYRICGHFCNIWLKMW